MERIFVARGALALAFAGLVYLAVRLMPDDASRVFAGFSILDGLLAIAAGYRAHPSLRSPRKAALFVEGIIESAAGIVIAIFAHDAPLIAFAIGANAVIGGALASVYSLSQRSEYRADWWAVYGIAGVLLGLAAGPLTAMSISALLIAAGAVAAVQGVARILLRGGPELRRSPGSLCGANAQ